MDRPFQRRGATSNTQVGQDFEEMARAFFAATGLVLKLKVSVEIGVDGMKRPHHFDLGCLERRVLVECKSHTWTEGRNVPSAKMTAWNQAMYFFYAAPRDYRKMLFVKRDHCEGRKETLAAYYVRVNRHLIPNDVEIWEYDVDTSVGSRVDAGSPIP